ncbi:UNKNOWN [Stylonychia lemnae]|uniref:Transmembrane protein n=1 Tax=Stylonychia lemnae TaxID=5949 RepID=A0A078A8M1_STYLE|nr:UNKNOWN [Stylonychia lemnae]|eukprot:CDW77141.1 UNKNOWN [Stylonychia lemnae]
MNYSSMDKTEMKYMSDQGVDIRFPLDRNQRYFMFKEMMMAYSFAWLEKPDHKRLSYYQQQAGAMILAWSGAAYYYSIQLAQNPQKFYQEFLLTRKSGLFSFVPLGVAAYYHFKQQKLYNELYEKYCGQLSDKELLQLDAKFNPKKKMFYDIIIQRNEKRLEMEDEKEQNRLSSLGGHSRVDTD